MALHLFGNQLSPSVSLPTPPSQIFNPALGHMRGQWLDESNLHAIANVMAFYENAITSMVQKSSILHLNIKLLPTIFAYRVIIIVPLQSKFHKKSDNPKAPLINGYSDIRNTFECIP